MANLVYCDNMDLLNKTDEMDELIEDNNININGCSMENMRLNLD